MSSVCNAGKKYGKTVRVKRQIDLRRFPPIPRATKKFERKHEVPGDDLGEQLRCDARGQKTPRLGCRPGYHKPVRLQEKATGG